MNHMYHTYTVGLATCTCHREITNEHGSDWRISTPRGTRCKLFILLASVYMRFTAAFRFVVRLGVSLCTIYSSLGTVNCA